MHALLTGLAFVIMNALNVRLGFGFSAGLFDYVLNFNKATHPLLLLPVGVAYFALYYGLFRFVISWLDLKTPGREDDRRLPLRPLMPSRRRPTEQLAYINALGGASNIASLDACTTRLRLVMVDQSRVDEAALKRLGARGMIKPSATALQVVVGAEADQVAGEMRIALRTAGAAASACRAGRRRRQDPRPRSPGDRRLGGASAPASPRCPAPRPRTAATLEANAPDPSQHQPSRPCCPPWAAAPTSAAIETASTRLRINIVDPKAVNESAITALGLRGIANAAPNWLHVIVGPQAASAGVTLRQLL